MCSAARMAPTLARAVELVPSVSTMLVRDPLAMATQVVDVALAAALVVAVVAAAEAVVAAVSDAVAPVVVVDAAVAGEALVLLLEVACRSLRAKRSLFKVTWPHLDHSEGFFETHDGWLGLVGFQIAMDPFWGSGL